MKKVLFLSALLVLTSCMSTKITTEIVEMTYADIMQIEDKEMSKGTQKVEEAIPEIKEIMKEITTDFFGNKQEKILKEVIIQEFIPKKITIGIKDVRVRQEVIKDQEIVVEQVEDKTLDKGVEQVVQEGKLGEVEITYEDIYYKGIFDRTQEVSRKVLVESEPKIINIGIKEVKTSNYLNYSNNDLSWWYRPGTPTATIDSKIAALITKYNVYWQIPTTQKVVYLTFDEGYEYKQNTLSILNTMKTKGVKATFFITGGYYNSHPELVKKMMAEGHQVANHTINHYRASTVLNQSTQKYIDDVVNLDKLVPGLVKLHRPPEGGYSERSLKILRDLGYKTVFWSFAYRDWETANQPDPVVAKQKILDNIHPGSILLLHAVSDTNVSILGDVIDGIRAKGYTIQQLPR